MIALVVKLLRAGMIVGKWGAPAEKKHCYYTDLDVYPT